MRGPALPACLHAHSYSSAPTPVIFDAGSAFALLCFQEELIHLPILLKHVRAATIGMIDYSQAQPTACSVYAAGHLQFQKEASKAARVCS